jgi:hypothetical protein
MLMLGGYVTPHGNDVLELAEVTGSVDGEVRVVSSVCADRGFYSEAAVKEAEAVDANGVRQGPEVFCAVERTGHHRAVKDLEAGNGQRGRVPEKAAAKERMAHKLRTERGRAIYKKRRKLRFRRNRRAGIRHNKTGNGISSVSAARA